MSVDGDSCIGRKPEHPLIPAASGEARLRLDAKSKTGPTREVCEAPARRVMLACRVDALVIAAQVKISPEASSEILRRQSLADGVGVADLRLGAFTFALKKSRRLDLVAFENADLRGTFITGQAPSGWNLEIIVRATFLATHPIEGAIALTGELARVFGVPQAMRLRRFDLAADYAGFPLSDDDAKNIVTRAAGIATFLSDSKDVDEVGGMLCRPRVREHRNAERVTGISVGSGGALMARLYDKSTELALVGREEKRVIEHMLWRDGGWDGSERVTRVEFQCRGEFLDEIRLRDPNLLPDRLDEVWQYAASWLRLVDPASSARRKRCTLDPRWSAVRATVFRHCAAPARRDRESRGAARASLVLGASLSFSALRGHVRVLDFGTDQDGKVLDEHSFASAMTEDEAAKWVCESVATVMADAGAGAARVLLLKHGARGAVVLLAARVNATVARFSSIDDRSKGTRE